MLIIMHCRSVAIVIMWPVFFHSIELDLYFTLLRLLAIQRYEFGCGTLVLVVSRHGRPFFIFKQIQI